MVEEWKDAVPVADELGKVLGTKVFVGNDVNVATEAEFVLGAGREFQSMLGVFWGTGVGGGIILDGKMWEGRGAGGEIGHMVVKIDGARCGCGRRGCMEAYAGRGSMELEARKRHEDGDHTDLFKIMKHKHRERLSSGVWAKALEHDDHMAKKLIERAVGALGAGRRVGGEPARHRGGHHRRRHGHPPRRGVRAKDQAGDDAAPLQGRTAACGTRRVARRPRRRDRRRPARREVAPG